MSSAAIQEQIKTIQLATKKAVTSKKAAMDFLQQAGIINRPAAAAQAPKASKSKKG
jgi:hypothetical protein